MSTRAAWFVRFLQRFPTAATVRALSLEECTAEVGTLSAEKWRNGKLAEMYAMAAETIGLPVPLDSPAIEMFRIQLARNALNQSHVSCMIFDRPMQRLAAIEHVQTEPREIKTALNQIAEQLAHHRGTLVAP